MILVGVLAATSYPCTVTTAWRWPGATATCPSGKKVIGGGGQCRSNTGFIWLTRSMPSGNNAWTASCDTTEDQNGSITVYAICQ
ncbi:shufflon protein B [Escherichia coli H4]|nr:shufflon protein B [Escherichia coli H4]